MSTLERNKIQQHLRHIQLEGDNKTECFYKKSSQDYNPDWVLQKAGYQSLNYQEALKEQKVQSYSQVGQEAQDLKKTYKLLKNQTVGSKFSQVQDPSQNSNLDELQKTKVQLDKGTVLSKPFAFQQSSIKYPEHGMKVGNPLYESEYMQVGKVTPMDSEVSAKFYPRDAGFTKNSTGNYRNNSLNCAWTMSKVHLNLNEF